VFGYLDGAAAVIGRGNVGIYGGRLAIDRALGATKAMWGWQTKSWSEGWSAKAHVQQYKHDVPLGRGRVDRDRAMTTDFGQWKVGDDMPLTDADKKWLEQEIRDAVNKHAVNLFKLLTMVASGRPHPQRTISIVTRPF
jgi:hypothetical protein